MYTSTLLLFWRFESVGMIYFLTFLKKAYRVFLFQSGQKNRIFKIGRGDPTPPPPATASETRGRTHLRDEEGTARAPWSARHAAALAKERINIAETAGLRGHTMAEGRRWAAVVAEGEDRREIVVQEATAALGLAAFVAAGVLWHFVQSGGLRIAVSPRASHTPTHPSTVLSENLSSSLVFETSSVYFW